MIGLLLLNASYTDWWGAACWGPRRLTEALPFLVLLSFWSLPRQPRRSITQGVLGVFFFLSVLVQAVGFFLYDSSWDAEHEPTQQMQMVEGALRSMPRAEAEATLWSWSEGPISDPVRGSDLQFVIDARYSLAAGTVAPAPIPSCIVLREVDRYP